MYWSHTSGGAIKTILEFYIIPKLETMLKQTRMIDTNQNSIDI